MKGKLKYGPDVMIFPPSLHGLPLQSSVLDKEKNLGVGWHYFFIKDLCHHNRDKQEYLNIKFFAWNKYLSFNYYNLNFKIY